MVFCCTSQTINDVEHFFMYLLTISVSLEKCQSPLPVFVLGCFLLNFRSSVYILDIIPSLNMSVGKFFSHFVGFFLTLLIVSFDAQNI